MSDAELRELDAWIAEHVMNLRVAIGRNQMGDLRCFLYDEFGSPERIPRSVFEPTADGFDSLSVLEKCYQKCGEVRIVNGVILIHDDIRVEAETLPLAICFFAKKLFSK